MIETVWVKNQNGSRLDLDLRTSKEDEGILIFNLTGLGSPTATVNGVGGPGFDGIRANSVRADSRHLVLTLAVPGTGAVEEAVKAKIYEHFPVKQTITFGITTETHELSIQAVVESNEFNQFAKVENAVISLLCPQPYFEDVSLRETTVSSGVGIPLFEFPFSNESLTEPLMIFGEVVTVPTVNITYNTGVETGCDINILLSGYVNKPTIANGNGGQVMTLDFAGAEAYFGSAAKAADQIHINTRVGEKSAWFVRDGVWYNMINGIGITDDWIQIRPGINQIVVTAVSGQDDMETDIAFHPLREGV